MRPADRYLELGDVDHPRARSFLCHAAIALAATTVCLCSPAAAQLRSAVPARAPAVATEPSGPLPDEVTVDAPDGRHPDPTDFPDCVMTRTLDIGGCSRRIAAERYWFLERCFDRHSRESQPVIIRACTFAIRNDFLEGRDRAYLFVNRADAYFRLGSMQAALADYNRALKLAPRRAELYYNRGVYYATLGDFVQARADFAAAAQLDSKLTAALLMKQRVGDGR